jgi:hypothetical protein
MKQCDICKVNPVKIAQTNIGDVCWRCYYINLYGYKRGMFVYKSIFKEKVNDEK